MQSYFAYAIYQHENNATPVQSNKVKTRGSLSLILFFVKHIANRENFVFDDFSTKEMFALLRLITQPSKSILLVPRYREGKQHARECIIVNTVRIY